MDRKTTDAGVRAVRVTGERPLRTDSDQQVTVGFFLLPDFPLLAFAAALDPLRQANRLAGKSLYKWVLIGEQKGPVTSSAGFAPPTDCDIATAPKCDIVIVCSGIEPERFYNSRILGWLRRLGRTGMRLGSLSTGAYLLGKAGLLDGRRCCVHWESAPAFQEEFPDVLATNDIFTVDGPFITSAGGTVTLDMMLSLIESYHGKRLALEISDQFNYPKIRLREEAQRLTPEAKYGLTHPKLAELVGLMQGSLEIPIPLSRLCARIGLSERQMERLFVTHVGKTPQAFYIQLRMELAFDLVSRTSLPLVTVARYCGYPSVPHFARTYRTHFGVSPSAARKSGSKSGNDRASPAH